MQSRFYSDESPHEHPLLPRRNTQCNEKVSTCAARPLPQAAEAKAYYGLARNYRALEALVAALEHREILSGDELREVRRRSPCASTHRGICAQGCHVGTGLGCHNIFLFSSSWRGVALSVVDGEQGVETVPGGKIFLLGNT